MAKKEKYDSSIEIRTERTPKRGYKDSIENLKEETDYILEQRVVTTKITLETKVV